MKMLERMDQKMRQVCLARNTRKVYLDWARRYFIWIVRKHGRSVHPEQLGKDAVEQWLTDLALTNNYSETTQNQALHAVLFLYHRVLEKKIEGVDALRAKKPTRVPVVLSLPESGRLLAQMHGIPLLIAKLQLGCGLRVGEAVSLRMKDICFDRLQLTIRMGKGKKDRLTILPAELRDDIEAQMKSAAVLCRADRASNMPGVSMPNALDRKLPSASLSWAWWYLFPAAQLSKHPDTGKLARHHLGSDHLNKHLSRASRAAKIGKRVTTHTLRHSFATHMLSAGTDIQTLASMMGHSDIRTTQIYLHCNANSGVSQRSPFAEILANPAKVAEHRQAS
jgi:integron integrase